MGALRPSFGPAQAVRGDRVERDIEDAVAAPASEAALAVDSDGALLQLLPETGAGPERNLRAAAHHALPEHATRLVPGPRPATLMPSPKTTCVF